MCWVMPPASPATTLVLRMASSSDVLPWSTWPMMVMTGARGLRSASESLAVSMTCSTSEAETRTTLWPNSSMMSSAVSWSMVWFWVAMMPLFMSALTTSAERSAMRTASSCTVIASGSWTSRTTFSLGAPDPIAWRRWRSCLRFMAASERWRPPPPPVASESVSLPVRRLSPERSLRRASGRGSAGRRSSRSLRAPPGRAPPRGSAGEPGIPASATAGAAARAARASSSALRRASSSARWRSASSRSRSSRSRASISARLRSRSSARARSSDSRRRSSSSLRALAIANAFMRRSSSASDSPPGRREGSPPGRTAGADTAACVAPGLGTTTRLRLVSTTTFLVRPCEKLCLTLPERGPPVLRPSGFLLSVSLMGGSIPSRRPERRRLPCGGLKASGRPLPLVR